MMNQFSLKPSNIRKATVLITDGFSPVCIPKWLVRLQKLFCHCLFKFTLVLNPTVISFLSSMYSQVIGQNKGAGKIILVSHCHLIMCFISGLFKFPLVLNPTLLRFLSSMFFQVVGQIKGASKNILVSHCHLIAYM